MDFLGMGLGDFVNLIRLGIDFYKLRGGRRAPDSDEPDPAKLEEAVAELESAPPGTSTDDALRVLESKLPASQMDRLKRDLATFSALASPRTPADFDYWSVLSGYACALRAIAIRANLFRLRGWKNASNRRFLTLPKTREALLPAASAANALDPNRETVSAEVTRISCLLVDEEEPFPVALGIDARYERRSYVGGPGPSDSKFGFYYLSPGQDVNWILFDNRQRDYEFKSFSRQLNATEAKEIVLAMKDDLWGYLDEIEAESTTVSDIKKELKGILDAVSRLQNGSST